MTKATTKDEFDNICITHDKCWGNATDSHGDDCMNWFWRTGGFWRDYSWNMTDGKVRFNI